MLLVCRRSLATYVENKRLPKICFGNAFAIENCLDSSLDDSTNLEVMSLIFIAMRRDSLWSVMGRFTMQMNNGNVTKFGMPT